MKSEKYSHKEFYKNLETEKKQAQRKTLKNVEIKYTERAIDHLRIQAGLLGHG